MESNEGRSVGRSLWGQKLAKGSTSTRLKNSWLGKNWSTVLVLVAIVLLALFVRTYFGYSTAVDNGFLVAGGSDSYYHERVIDYVNAHGSHLVNDPALNYPFGVRNERPPLYDWSVAIGGQALSGLSGMNLSDATGYSLLFSSALWGSLTCIPVYLITKGAFGNRAGILAALLLAFMPGHISRSIFADADHDATILFFVVFALYFLMRALQSMKGTKWVSSWKSPGSIRTGFKSFFQQNQKALIYAVLGGTCIATVAMMWTGYTYILVIILVYFLVQALINRFRNVDSMGEFMIVGVMLLTAFALTAPLYWQLSYWSQWFDTPFYLFVGSMIIGGFFTVTRDYPWTLTLPILIAIVAVGLVGVFFLDNSLFTAIVTGQGYLVKTKLASTIDEAAAPDFSTLVFNFGVVTFWLAIIGLVWAAIKIPKNQSPYYVFVVVWIGVSMYMAASASRFMFNASPVFAMAGGWILALILGLVKFNELPRLLSGFWANPRSTFRKAFKFRYVAAALFLAFLVVLPNVWTAVDAGIPSENKAEYDQEVHDALPDFLRSSGYDPANGTWYFGAFPYSLDLPSTYWPQAWDWFRTQDANITDIQDKPAFLSWWDYGFEAIQEGQHPTVADNFQNGYEFAGTFITSQNETDAVALFIVRVLEQSGFNDTITQVLQSNGVDVAKLQDIMTNPQNYVDEVKNNPLIYGPYDSDLSVNNAKYAAARVTLEKIGLDNLVTVYHQLRDATGTDIGYFAVDGRLFPWSAQSQSIFYAPAELADRVIDPVTNAPTDYYQIKAITTDYEEKDIADLTSSDTVLTYVIEYKDAFYDTMLYRSFMGISPEDIGSTSQGIPGISGSLSSYDAMPGYNLTHFREVYRTAYFNPYTDAANHTDAWQAVSYEQAQDLKSKIDAGEMEGTVDMSAAALQSGVVFMQYYDGAIVDGIARSSDGTPYAGIYVTVVDEYGIPHQTVKTDADGHYSVILPFGNVSVVYSAGTLNNATQIASEIDRVNYTISYGQAMREGPASDWTFDGNITLPGSFVSGSVFYDQDGDGRYDAGDDQYISGAQVTLTNPSNGFTETVTTGAMGSYHIIGLAGSSQTLTATYQGHTLSQSTITLAPSGNANRSIAVKPGSITGTITLPSGSPAGGVNLTLTDQSSSKTYQVTSDSNGKFTFSDLLPGDYTLATTDPSLSVGTQTVSLAAGQTATEDLKLVQATAVTGTVTVDGTPQANVPVVFHSEQREVSVLTDASGGYSIALPQGEYSVYAMTIDGDSKHAAMCNFTADAETATLNIALVPATAVTGTVRSGNDGVSGAVVVFTDPATGAYVKATANSAGEYNVILPIQSYFLYAQGAGQSYWESNVAIADGTTMDIALADSVYLTGTVFNDLNGNGVQDSGESGISGALLTAWAGDNAAEKLHFASGSSGLYNITVPAGSYLLNATMDGYSSWQGGAGTDVDIPLIALNRTVSGTVTSSEGAVGSGVVVNFTPTDSSGQGANATTDANGQFNHVSLKPGTYWVTIDQNAAPGDDSRRYSYNTTLTVPIARDPEALSVNATVKYKVDGTIITPNGGEGTVRLIGPENRTVDAASPFPMYLTPGHYTIYIHLVNGNDHYVYLGAADVVRGANNLGDMEVQTASALDGQVQFGSTDLAVPANISIANAAAPGSPTLTLTASSTGAFEAYLPDGTYEVSADYATQTTVEDGSSRYVRYHNESMPVTVHGGTPQWFELVRSLNNATLAGTISGAGAGVSWQFVGQSTTAMDATATSAADAYSVSLAPGVYSVYASDGLGKVYLGILNVKPNVANTFNVTLQSGTEISGTVRYNGAPQGGATVTFADNAVATTTTQSDGQYSIYLPDGYYNVTAKAVNDDEVDGVNITYSRSFDLSVGNASIARDIDLTREINGAVQVQWDSSQKQTVDPGGKVTYTVTIKNVGNIDDTYTLSTTSDWDVEFSQKTVVLPWGAGNGATVQVTITAPADAKVTDPGVKIVATSANRTGAEGSATLNVGITPIYSVNVSQGEAPTANGTAVTCYVLVKNTGTASDIFQLDLTNVGDLAGEGWSATITGTSQPYKNLTIAAGSSQTVSVTLTKNSAEAQTDLALDVTVQSKSQASSSGSASLILTSSDLSVPGDQLTASGHGASMDAPQMTGTTWLLLVLIVLTLVGLVVLKVNKGVFGRRRKR